jgi:hypothetical protein
MSKNKINKTTEMSALAVLLLICFCQTGMAAESSVSVSPQTITSSQGDVFSIDIIVDPAGSDIYGAQYKLYFDKNMLKAISQNQGTFLSHNGSDTIEVTNNIDNATGRIDYGETRIGDPETVGGASEKDVLASITFKVIGSGTSDLRLEAMLSDSSAQKIDAVVSNGTCTAGGGETGQTPTPITTTAASSPSREHSIPVPGAVFTGLALLAAWTLRKQ